jgi:DNA polymerase III delta prime subunit
MKNPICLQLKEHISKKIEEWQSNLNLNYKTDAESSIIDYAKGQLKAYIEVLEFINQEEKLNEQKRIAEEEGRVRKQAGEVRKSSLHKI